MAFPVSEYPIEKNCDYLNVCLGKQQHLRNKERKLETRQIHLLVEMNSPNKLFSQMLEPAKPAKNNHQEWSTALRGVLLSVWTKCV